jgi:hypothetical protein
MLRGGTPVVVAPCETLCDQLAALKGLHELDDDEVADIHLRVLRQVEVLLRIQDSLCDQINIIFKQRVV